MLLITVLLWSTSGLFVKIIDWQPLSILSARSIVASFVFLIYLRRLDLNWTWVQIAGALAYVGAQLFFIMGTKITAAANVIFLTYTSPVYIILFGRWFLKEKAYPADWASIVVIFAGMLLFIGDDLTWTGFRGNLFGILAGISMAAMVLCLRKQKSGEPAKTILLGNIIASLIGLPALFQETFSPSSMGIILYLGLLQTGLAFILYSIAIKYLQALESTLVLTLEPILNPIWVFLAIGETPGPLAVVGGILVIGAVLGRAIISARTPSNEQVVPA
jgi:drug/metabolite transporter (DMT)-like permease